MYFSPLRVLINWLREAVRLIADTRLSRTSSRVYVLVVSTAAFAAVLLLRVFGPDRSGTSIITALVFCALAVTGDLVAARMRDTRAGSIAFIPYLACIVGAPGWDTVLVIITSKFFTEAVLLRGDWVKSLFNAAALGLTTAAGIGIYGALGGATWLSAESSLAGLLQRFGFPALIALGVSHVAHMLLIGTAIAISGNEPLRTVLREQDRPIGVALLSVPVVLVFAWLFSRFGAFGSIGFWIPLMGLKHLASVEKELESTNRELLELMVKTVESRDRYFAGHSRRVAMYAVGIGRMLGLKELQLKDVQVAALLHDVGTIYEKYAGPLRAEGRLSADQWGIVKEHPVDGANLIQTIRSIRHLASSVRHHHENWDGSGYPDGLAGPEIPLISRIVQLAETIDAMTSDRPYRPSLTEDELRAELRRGRGKQFDPAITDQLLGRTAWESIIRPQGEGHQKTHLGLLRTKESMPA